MQGLGSLGFLPVPASLRTGHLDFWTPGHLSLRIFCKKGRKQMEKLSGAVSSLIPPCNLCYQWSAWQDGWSLATCTPEHLATRFFSSRPTKQCWTVKLLSKLCHIGRIFSYIPPTLGRQWLTTATLEIWTKSDFLELETLQTFDQSDVKT